MTVQVDAQEARSHLSRLLARAEAGEDVVITRNSTLPEASADPLPEIELEQCEAGWRST